MGRSKVAISLEESTLTRLDKKTRPALKKSAQGLIRHLRRRLQKRVFLRTERNGPNTEG
jgi:hypothetical protein